MTTEAARQIEVILEGSARTIKEVTDNVMDIPTLQEFGAAERAGQNRAGVLNDIQNRIGQRIMAGQDFSTVEGRTLGQSQGDIVETREEIGAVTGQNTADAGITNGTVTHRHPRDVVAYFKEADGWKPRTLPVTNLQQVLARGAKEFCPDCGRQFCRIDMATLRFTGDMNGCPGREPVPFMRCPVAPCAKRIFDHIPEEVDAPAADAMEIKSQRYSDVTPAARIEARLNQHMLAYHPQEAAALGLRTQNPRDQLTDRDVERVS